MSGLGAQAWLTRVTFVDLVHGAKYGGGEGERAATCLTDLLAHTRLPRFRYLISVLVASLLAVGVRLAS